MKAFRSDWKFWMFPDAIIPLYIIIPVHLFSFCRDDEWNDEWTKANATAEQQYPEAQPLHNLHETAGQNQQMQLIAAAGTSGRRVSARLSSQGTHANYTEEYVTTDESRNQLHPTHS